MPYYTAEEMKEQLNDYPQYADRLYCRGFLLTTKQFVDLSDYPFYSNWKEKIIPCGSVIYYLYTHHETYSYVYRADDNVFFLIGHAYDPFHMTTDENAMLKDMAESLSISENAYWDRESDLTGVFFTGFMSDGKITYSTDCCGMQYVCYGVVNGDLFLSSHSKLIADLCGLEQDPFVKRLVNSKMWRFYGRWLPGDISPFKELKRLQPNNKGQYDAVRGETCIERYYPVKPIEELKTEEEYQNRIAELGNIMSRTMKLISEKWKGKNISISVTGGRDSMTTLACTNGLYDRFHYFSYISNEPESIDAYASDKICGELGLEHDIYQIPEESEDYKNIEIFSKILECNSGCIGKNNANDVRKRLYFIQNPKFDLEVKSWVNEMGRGWYYRKYKKKAFPNRPTAAILRSMHKPYLSPYIIHHTTKVFQDWIDTYCGVNVLDRMSWLDLFFWEFSWSAYEGMSLTAEHRISYDITVPFNNRKYVELMLTLPLEKRAADQMPIDLIGRMNKVIIDSGIVIKDVNLSDLRTVMVRTYFSIFSKINI